VEHYPGPLVLGAGLRRGGLEMAAGLAAAYSDASKGTAVTVNAEPGGPERRFHLTNPAKERFKPWLV